MDKVGDITAGSANNSSDFVGLALIRDCNQLILFLRSANCTSKPQETCVVAHGADANQFRMLEDPSYDQVVRWGNEGDSFVVLEASTCTKATQRLIL